MLRALVDWIARTDVLSFHLTNRIPRRLATRVARWFSGIEQPIVARLSIGALAFFAGDLHLDEASTTEFRSLRDCFTRRLKPDARPIDATPGVLVSPCDGVIVASGRIIESTLIQAKGRHYTLEELLADRSLVERYRNGWFVTVRLTAAMYHRFHAPANGTIDTVQLIPGDVWNVNPATLARVDRVYCRNTRAVIPIALGAGESEMTLVPVGAVLVSSIRLALLDRSLRPGSNPCAARVSRGQELGYFEHGSTIVALTTPDVVPEPDVSAGVVTRVGRALWRHLRNPD